MTKYFKRIKLDAPIPAMTREGIEQKYKMDLPSYDEDHAVHVDEEGKKWLFLVKEGPSMDITSPLSTLSEAFHWEFANQIKRNVPTTHVVDVEGGKSGVLTKSFLEDGEFLKNLIDIYPQFKDRAFYYSGYHDMRNLNMETVSKEVLSQTSDEFRETFYTNIIDKYVFANIDSHNGHNFGVIFSGVNARMSPTYDLEHAPPFATHRVMMATDGLSHVRQGICERTAEHLRQHAPHLLDECFEHLIPFVKSPDFEELCLSMDTDALVEHALRRYHYDKYVFHHLKAPDFSMESVDENKFAHMKKRLQDIGKSCLAFYKSHAEVLDSQIYGGRQSLVKRDM